MGTLLLLFCSCFAALLTAPMLSMAQADEDEIKPPPGRQDLKTPEMQYFINIAPLPPGKPCNPSSHNQVVIFWFVVPLIICTFLWVLGRALYRGWRLRKQQELVRTSVAFANSAGISPPISELPTDNSPVNSPVTPLDPPISELPTENSPVMPSDNFDAIPPQISVLPSAPPIEVITCHRCGYPECTIVPSQLVCPSCGNMRPLNV